MEYIERNILKQLLLSWQKGELSEREVHEQAEVLWSQNPQWEEYLPNDPRSINFEVAQQLELLPVQLIIPDDIPYFLTFLETPFGQEKEAWEFWTDYWNSIDFEERLIALLDNPYYSKLPIQPFGKAQ